MKDLAELNLIKAHLAQAHERLRLWLSRPNLDPEERRHIQSAVSFTEKAESSLK